MSYNPCINPLNAELNPICPLLALFGAEHILHISRKRVKHTLDNGQIRYTPHIGVQKPHKINCCMRINE